MIRGRWLLVLAGSLAFSAGNAQPKISIEGGTKFDMGTIYRGNPGQKTIAIKNIGTDTLVLGQVEVSCGCTGWVVSNNRIAAGETGELLITFNSGGYLGEVHKTVMVNSNDVESPKTLIEFTTTVLEVLTIDPRQLRFTDAEVGKVDTFALSVTNTGNEPFAMTGYQSSLSGLSLDLRKDSIKPGETVRFRGKLESTAPKVLTDVLTVQTSSKKQPGIDINIFGAIKEKDPK